MLTDPYSTLRYIEIFACVSVIISSLELLVRPQELADDGLMSWQVAKLRSRWLVWSPIAELTKSTLSYPKILWLYRLRFLAAVLMLIIPQSAEGLKALAAGLVFLCSVGQSTRTVYGLDGADQMTLITFLPLTLAYAIPSPPVVEACIGFIALQGCLSYLTAGMAKAVSSDWRGEAALTGIFSTGIYGNEALAKFLRARPRFAKWLSRSIIVAEISFPLVLILPPPLNGLILAGGVVFHGATAIVMGLNTFFWSFIATYPAILYFANRLQTFT